MTKLLIGGLTAAAFAVAPALAQPPAGTQAQPAQAPKSRANVQAAVARHFARIDANHDGFVSKAEVEALHAKRGERGADRQFDRGRMFDRLDANKDGNISRAEFDAVAPRGGMHGGRGHAGMTGGLGGRMFEMGDANKDGRVSLAEAEQAALRHFDRFDLNHDGQISPEERSQARQQLRAQRKPG